MRGKNCNTKREIIDDNYIYNELRNICLILKQVVNIGDKYMEFLSALIYMIYEFRDRFFDNKFELIDIRILDYCLGYLREKEKSNRLFINIDFSSVIRKNNYEKFLKVFNDIIYLMKNIDNDVVAIKAKISVAFEKCITDAVADYKKSFLKYNFHTPKEVVNIMINLLNIKDGDKIYNPVSGIGNFITESSKNKNVISIGECLDINTYNICMTNLWLHNVKGATILENIRVEKDEFLKANIAMCNPPFVDKTEINEEESYMYYRYGVINSKNVSGYIRYLILLLENINEMGKIAMIVPNGFLFKKQEQYVRKYLLDKKWIKAIISLPENLFIETRIPINILIIDKSKKNDDILFIDASDEFMNKSGKNILTPENQKKIIETYKEYKIIEGYSYVANYDEICKNNYDLNIKKYVKKIKLITVIDSDKLEKEIEVLEEERKKIQSEILKVINEL